MGLWALPSPQQSMVAADMTWSASSLAAFTATASATPHTKGAWVEVEASTSAEWAGVRVIRHTALNVAATDTSTLLDIGLGASGSEVVVVSNLPVGYSITGGGFDLPIRVPTGTRVAVRVQSARASQTAAFRLVPWTGEGVAGSRTYQTATTYGANTATSRGVTVTASAGTINTFGAWTSIVAATSAPIRAMVVGIQGNGDTDLAASAWRLEIGYGGAGSEQAIATLGAIASSSEAMSSTPGSLHTVPTDVPFTVSIPEGARLVARLMTATSTTTNPAVDVAVIGLR
jgi:hypothetical protein